MPLEWHYACNGLNTSKVVTTGTMILGMFIIVLLVLYSTLLVGSLTTFISPPSSLRAVGHACIGMEQFRKLGSHQCRVAGH
ncbi:putative serine incorporator/TMS membrane protein [Helianthus anomalus]